MTSILSNSSFRKGISIILIAASFSFIGWLIFREWPALSGLLTSLNSRNVFFLILATLIASAAVGILFFVFQLIFDHNTDQPFTGLQLAEIFFNGQIVRYVPGRFFGIVYQINKISRDVAPSVIVKVNIEFILLVIYFNILIPFSVILAFSHRWLLSIFLLMTGLGLAYLYLKLNGLNALMTQLKKIGITMLGRAKITELHYVKYNNVTILNILAIFLLYYVLYFSGWLLLKNVFDTLSATQALILCASYTLSWVVGHLSMVTPGGLGVREVSFVLLSSKILPHAQSSFLAVFVRLWLVLIDVLLFVFIQILKGLMDTGRTRIK